MTNFLPCVPAVPDSGRWKPVVRGYPEGTEVLTEVGWVDFGVLFNEQLLGGVVPFVGNGFNMPGYSPKFGEWGQWLTGERFPRVGTVDPVSGGVVFVRPSRFQYFSYTGRVLEVKMKGVHLLCASFTDLWLKPRYGRSWKFVVGDDVVRNIYGSANYGLLNKWNVDMYGMWSPAGLLNDTVRVGGSVLPESVNNLGVVNFGATTPKSGSEGGVYGLGSDISCVVGSPIVVFPKKHVRRRRVWDLFEHTIVDPVTGETVVVDRVRDEVGVFNVVVEPFHNIIVRRGRKNDNPRTLWVGGPVVVGDGVDKSLLRVGSVGRGGGSYSGLRPDIKSISANHISKREQ